MLLLLVPMTGLAVDIVWLGKHLTAWQGLGAGIVLVGLIVDAIAGQRLQRLDGRRTKIERSPKIAARSQPAEQKSEKVE